MLVNDIFNYTLVLDFENKQKNWQKGHGATSLSRRR